MYTPIHLLPQYNISEANKYQERWHSNHGQSISKKIINMITTGAGEDFLENGLGNDEKVFLENTEDLKGFCIYGIDVDFPKEDNFEYINFSYATFIHNKFMKATFDWCDFKFARISKCVFIDCVFKDNSFYACTFENVKFINCDFIEGNIFRNCSFSKVEFEKYHIPENIFLSCAFNENTTISNPEKEPLQSVNSGILKWDDKSLSTLYREIKEAYLSNNVTRQYLDYHFKENQSITNYNTISMNEKIVRKFFEIVTGYGMKPQNVLKTVLIIFVYSLIFFLTRIELGSALLLTAGAFLTFGANVNLLNNLNIFFKVVYVFTAFSGISMIALFITVLVNRWLKERY